MVDHSLHHVAMVERIDSAAPRGLQQPSCSKHCPAQNGRRLMTGNCSWHEPMHFIALWFTSFLLHTPLCSILFYSTLFYPILFYSTLFFSILFLTAFVVHRKRFCVGPMNCSQVLGKANYLLSIQQDVDFATKASLGSRSDLLPAVKSRDVNRFQQWNHLKP